MSPQLPAVRFSHVTKVYQGTKGAFKALDEVSFDIEQASVKDGNDRTRIQVAFLRLGWEHIGGSCWRYPALGTQHASEDWMNHVVPALMYLRSIVEHSGMNMFRFTIDAHSEAGFRGDLNPIVGQAILPSGQIVMYPTGLQPNHEDKLSEARLQQFIADAATSLQ